MEKARGEPSAPFISGAAWNLPTLGYHHHGRGAGSHPSVGNRVIPALPAMTLQSPAWSAGPGSISAFHGTCLLPCFSLSTRQQPGITSAQVGRSFGGMSLQLSLTDESPGQDVPPKHTVPNSSPLELSKNIASRLDFSLLALKKLWNTVRSHPTHIWSLFLHFTQFCFFPPLFTF